MSRPVAVLRPEPGNARTAAAIEALGGRAIRLPLFAVVPVAWTPPDPAAADALVATSANAFRHGGVGLAMLRGLPVHAVGAATAQAARAAGFTVARTGTADARSLIATIPAGQRLLHLAGKDHVAIPDAVTIPVYAAPALPIDADAIAALAGSVALLHSVRAAQRLRALVDRHDTIAIVALADAVAAAAGSGWASVAVAPRSDDASLVALALRHAVDGAFDRALDGND